MAFPTDEVLYDRETQADGNNNEYAVSRSGGGGGRRILNGCQG